jgi:hypothetical protein
MPTPQQRPRPSSRSWTSDVISVSLPTTRSSAQRAREILDLVDLDGAEARRRERQRWQDDGHWRFGAETTSGETSNGVQVRMDLDIDAGVDGGRVRPDESMTTDDDDAMLTPPPAILDQDRALSPPRPLPADPENKPGSPVTSSQHFPAPCPTHISPTPTPPSPLAGPPYSVPRRTLPSSYLQPGFVFVGRQSYVAPSSPPSASPASSSASARRRTDRYRQALSQAQSSSGRPRSSSRPLERPSSETGTDFDRRLYAYLADRFSEAPLPARRPSDRGRDREHERERIVSREDDRAGREEWQVRVTLDAVDLEHGTVKGIMRQSRRSPWRCTSCNSPFLHRRGNQRT